MKNIPALVIGLLLFVLIGFLVERHHLQAEVRQLRLQSNRIPTFTELQEMLVAKGYDLKVDGIIGIETIMVWDKAISQQYASRWDYFYENDKKLIDNLQ